MITNPKTPAERLAWLYQFGHAWNPRFPNLQNLDAGRVAKMDGSEEDARQLVQSFQELDENVERLVAAFHGRPYIPDGDVGPATAGVMSYRRCSMPDFAPPPTASFHYADPELQAAVESYQRFAAAGYVGGSGSWPKGCDPQHKDVHSVVVGIDTSNASAFQKGIMADVLRYVEETEAEMGQSVRHVLDGSFAKPQHEVRFQYIAGGVIGFAYFPQPDTCNQSVTARIDNSFDARLPVLAELLTHEYKGHSDGLEHSRGGIMNPSIGSPTARATWKGDPHERTKARYFGGVAIPGTTPPTPPTPPTIPPTVPGDPWAGVVLTATAPGKPSARFIRAREV
jgi:hypothetical protein